MRCSTIILAGSVLALISSSIPALAAEEQAVPAMTKEEVTALLKGKLTLIDRAQGRSYGNVVRAEFEDGKVSANSSSGMYNTGSFSVNDDGSMCQQWNDTRWGDKWCYNLYRDGGVVKFKTITVHQGRDVGIIKWEYEQ